MKSSSFCLSFSASFSSLLLLLDINTDFSEQRFPVLHRWMKVMMEKEEAVQSTALPFDVHVKLTKSLTERTPIDYSLADTNGDSVIVYAASPN